MLLTEEQKETLMKIYGDKNKKIYMPDFSIDEDFSSHIVGNEDCEEGFCGCRCDYPRKCTCGGLIHAEFGDEDADCNFWLYTRCDKCGERGDEE